jgi:hypothetical protein
MYMSKERLARPLVGDNDILLLECKIDISKLYISNEVKKKKERKVY